MPSDEWSCGVCGFDLWLPVAVKGLKVTHLGMYSDARFPGRCLVLNDHYEGMEDMPAALPRRPSLAHRVDALPVPELQRLRRHP